MSGSDPVDDRADNRRLTRAEALRVPHVFQAVQPGEERRLIAERRARALAAARATVNAAAREQAATAAEGFEMSSAAATSSVASSSATNGTMLGMPTSSTGTSSLMGSRQSTSQMAGSQFSPLTPRERELREIQQVERLCQKLEEDLKKATEREREIKSRAARLEALETDKAELEGLDESGLSEPLKVLKNNMLSLHAHVDSRLDFMQSTLDQILDILRRPGFRPPAQSPLPLSAMSGPFPVQAGTQPSGEGKGEALNTWLRTVPVWVKAKRTLLEDEVVTAASYLEGKATKWLDGVVIKAGYGRRMADWAKSLTLDQFMEMVEARWHNPQEAQKATDAINKLDQRKFKSVRELTTTVESLILVPGINYSDQFLLTTFVRCLPENIRNLLASEARVKYHSFETLSRKALDLEATLGNAQPTSQNDSKKKKSPQEWKKKGAKLMMVESDGTQIEIDKLSDLVDYSEYDGEEVAEGSTLAAVVKAKAGQSVSMDFMDTLVTSKSGKRHIFVIIDRFTKYARLVAMPETARTDYVIKLFEDNWSFADEFGVFPIDWRDLAIPRRGGFILESFNSDEVIDMAPWHRAWEVGKLARRISDCIERASLKNRLKKGVRLEIDGDDDLAYELPWQEYGSFGVYENGTHMQHHDKPFHSPRYRAAPDVIVAKDAPAASPSPMAIHGSPRQKPSPRAMSSSPRWKSSTRPTWRRHERSSTGYTPRSHRSHHLQTPRQPQLSRQAQSPHHVQTPESRTLHQPQTSHQTQMLHQRPTPRYPQSSGEPQTSPPPSAWQQTPPPSAIVSASGPLDRPLEPTTPMFIRTIRDFGKKHGLPSILGLPGRTDDRNDANPRNDAPHDNEPRAEGWTSVMRFGESLWGSRT
ncbi:hypothetical protein CBR_g12625 [Chara braunii]|uniref:Integrase catalytic domain-containing protein n=1 Tax=Chara braunii TaxID=69332 RepID=A0A388KS54_CHABU|nr:hypothetical protein CBR_g12625 [Chara braunii]|eukprot:GBG72905.1 hypothetical protein CBR_g12625 [Chara braunii]